MAVIADPRLRPRARARRRARTRRLPTGLRHRIYLTRVSFFSLGGSGKHYTGPERARTALHGRLLFTFVKRIPREPATLPDSDEILDNHEHANRSLPRGRTCSKIFRLNGIEQIAPRHRYAYGFFAAFRWQTLPSLVICWMISRTERLGTSKILGPPVR